MDNKPSLHGQTALMASQARMPKMILTLYEHVMLLKKRGENGSYTEFAVAPNDVVKAISDDALMETGFLSGNVLGIAEKGLKRRIVVYRPPSVEGIWLEGQASASHVPLPPMVMVRETSNSKNATYSMYAVKERPQSIGAQLYLAPFPNIHGSTGSCWGSVKQPANLHPNDLTPDWQQWLGSRFGGHSVSKKSVAFPDDLREHYKILHDAKATEYPLEDLIEMKDWCLEDILHIGGRKR